MKIIGPDLAGLERLADKVLQAIAEASPASSNVGVFHIMGQSNLDLPHRSRKCARWGVSVADVQDVIATAVGGKAFSQMIEGERSFDITLRWPERCGNDEPRFSTFPSTSANNVVIAPARANASPTLLTGAASGPPPSAPAQPCRRSTGSTSAGRLNDLTRTPRRRLGDLVTPLGCRRPARSPRLVRAARRLRHLPRAGRPADRHQVRRPRPRPGRRRGRGAKRRRAADSSRPIAPIGAASSRKWNRPKAG